jgi:uncharacterized membrane protein YkgB
MNTLLDFDRRAIEFFKKISLPLARFGIFLVFFWFGYLKLIGLSPASELVEKLFMQTIPVIPFSTFIILFGAFECVIGALFLIPGFERIVIPLLAAHMITTILPLFLLVNDTWNSFLVPTLEGQYIIKNILIIALAVGVAAELNPLDKKGARSR